MGVGARSQPGLICAYDADSVVGFVNVAWDGGVHAFLLDPLVHPDYRHRGAGTAMIMLATEAARDAGCEYLHVDFEERLREFYERCGFEPTAAGLIRLV